MSKYASREFNPLSDCTETNHHNPMLLKADKFSDRNRYSDILAYKHSRVHLVPRQNDNEEDPEVAGYINANFVDGPLGSIGNRKLIACQGPKANTYPDLWRMIA